jgi:hypothetical protein
MGHVFHVGREELPGHFQGLLGFAQGLHRNPQNGVNDGKIIGGIREFDLLIGSVFIQGLLQGPFRFGDDIVCALDGGKSD